MYRVEQARHATARRGHVLPTARKMAEIYAVASMTAQRALRELQTLGLTYGIVGTGTFAHPEAPDRIGVNIDGQPADRQLQPDRRPRPQRPPRPVPAQAGRDGDQDRRDVS